MATRRYRLGQRQVAADQTHARILAGARRLLGARAGPSRFSMDAVARAARLARLTVYNHFGSRAALLEALFDDMGTRGGMDRIVAALGRPDPHQALTEYVTVLCGFWASNQLALRRLGAMAVLDAELERAISARTSRRRGSTLLLARRLGAVWGVPPETVDEVGELLFVLTSFETFEALTAGRSQAETVRLLLRLLTNALDGLRRSEPG